MPKVLKDIFMPLLGLLLAMALAAGLAGCQDNSQEAADDAASEAAEPAYTDEEVTAVLLEAAGKSYDNFSFAMESSTKATYPATSTSTSQQTSAKTKMTGEMDISGDSPNVHMTMEAENNSNSSAAVTFDMYVKGDDVVIEQDDQTYVDTISNTGIDSYYASVPQIVTAETIQATLDMASSMKMEEREGSTVITVVADSSKLSETVEGTGDDGVSQSTGLTSLVTVYTIDADGYITKVAMTGGANGTPTYHVRQTYTYTKFDETELPEIPDTRYAGIDLQTDENGRQYVTDDDGVRYYLAEDGQFYSESQPVYEQPQQTVTKKKTKKTTQSTEATEQGSAPSSSASSSEAATSEAAPADPNEGRAYITTGDGTIHFLDEPGSEIRDFGGTRVFIDADGNWYFLSED